MIYTYDNMGNIATISINGVQKVRYLYDSLNQLQREDNVWLNKSIVYTYDNGGNITAITEYAYTTGTLGSPTATSAFTYGDTNWKDKLTSYSGQTFLYDDNGGRVGLQYNGANYLYVYNAQGDVTAIVDSNHNVVVSYTYDEWGNKMSVTGSMASTLGVQNPFRYRGYRYDAETELYYLQSRYYDLVTGRFLNADSQLNDDILGNNIFVYCGNNPIMRSDPTGHAWWHWAIAAAVVVGCVVATVATAGGFAAGAVAIGMAASGVSVGGAAGVFTADSIGSGMALAGSAMFAASTSNSVSEFSDIGRKQTLH